MNQQQPQFNVILIGDNCVDKYTYGEVNRISPEAPIPIFKFLNEKDLPGMAANVQRNLVNLGLNVTFYTGKESIKNRLIDINSKQHMLRIDDDVLSDPLDISDISFDCDAVLLSDYDKGLLTYDNMRKIISICNEKGIPIFIDTKKQDLKKFNGSFVKINETEYNNAISYCENMIVTHGSKSVYYNGNTFDVNSIDVVDVCGAGETFFSALVYKFLHTKSIEKSIPFAVDSASVTVKKLGVYAPTLEEINE